MGAYKTAAMLAIGDELLSGRTRDANIHHIAGWLTDHGVDLKEVRIVSDEAADIVEAVNALRGRYDYVFTSGGIGPTHDDITADAVAAAFDAPIDERADALEVLQNWYGDEAELNAPRRRMARIPDGARLIANPVSGAPGFQMDNVFVMAGVPKIFQAMLADVEPHIEAGAKVHSVSLTSDIPESRLAQTLEALQDKHADVSIGSYPFRTETTWGATIVMRSRNLEEAERVAEAVRLAMAALGATPVRGDGRPNEVK